MRRSIPRFALFASLVPRSPKGDSMATHPTQSNKATKTSNPDDFTPERVKELTDALNALLADIFTLYIKTKNSTGT